MQFHSRDAIGKAGERVFEAFVEEKLLFIYRKIGHPDIGLDGEIEILDKNRHSTGEFLKVQVKTSESSFIGQAIRVPFDQGHYNYFCSLITPPMLAVVSLADKKIWWKILTHNAFSHGPRNGISVHLDFVSDELTLNAKSAIHNSAARSNGLLARNLLDRIEAKLSKIDRDEELRNWDIVTVESWAVVVRDCTRMWHKAHALLATELRKTPEVLSTRIFSGDIFSRIQIREEWFIRHDLESMLNKLHAGEEYYASLRHR